MVLLQIWQKEIGIRCHQHLEHHTQVQPYRFHGPPLYMFWKDLDEHVMAYHVTT